MDRLRLSMLYLPGDNQRFLAKALAGDANSIILDLEDAVAPHRKPATRLAVVEVLRGADFGVKEKVVRVNSLRSPYGIEDVKVVVPAAPHTLIVPKFGGAQDVQEMDDLITEVEKAHGLPAGGVKIMPLIETPQGVINAEAIAAAKLDPTAVALITDYDKGDSNAADPDSLAYSAAEGDQIDLSTILSSAFGGGQAANALVRIVEHPGSPHALLQVDADGTANGVQWTTIAELDGIHTGAASL